MYKCRACHLDAVWALVVTISTDPIRHLVSHQHHKVHNNFNNFHQYSISLNLFYLVFMHLPITASPSQPFSTIYNLGAYFLLLTKQTSSPELFSHFQAFLPHELLHSGLKICLGRRCFGTACLFPVYRTPGSHRSPVEHSNLL